MKKLTVTMLASALLGLSAYAQGTISFVNLNAGAGINAPITLSDGTTKLSGTGYMAALMVGTTDANLAQVATTGFLTGGGAGYFNGGAITVPGIAGGTAVSVQINVWNTAAGSTFAVAQAAGVGGMADAYGQSGILHLTLGDPGASPPTTPVTLNGLTSFHLNPAVPEPSSLALAGLGAAAMLVFRRRK